MSAESDVRMGMLETRLACLERSTRRWRIVAGVCLLGAVGAGLAGLSTSAVQPNREVIAHRLIINGSDGKPRAMMQGMDDGSAFFLYGPDEYKPTGGGGAGAGGVGGMSTLTPRLRFFVDAEASSIEFLDPNGPVRMKLRLDADGPTITRFDAEGNEIGSAEE